MSRVVISLDQNCKREELEAVVDGEIAAWDEWFQKELGNTPLAPSERAILKTYLGAKLLPQLKEEKTESSLPPL